MKTIHGRKGSHTWKWFSKSKNNGLGTKQKILWTYFKEQLSNHIRSVVHHSLMLGTKGILVGWGNNFSKKESHCHQCSHKKIFTQFTFHFIVFQARNSGKNPYFLSQINFEGTWKYHSEIKVKSVKEKFILYFDVIAGRLWKKWVSRKLRGLVLFPIVEEAKNKHGTMKNESHFHDLWFMNHFSKIQKNHWRQNDETAFRWENDRKEREEEVDRGKCFERQSLINCCKKQQ